MHAASIISIDVFSPRTAYTHHHHHQYGWCLRSASQRLEVS